MHPSTRDRNLFNKPGTRFIIRFQDECRCVGVCGYVCVGEGVLMVTLYRVLHTELTTAIVQYRMLKLIAHRSHGHVGVCCFLKLFSSSVIMP